MATPGAVVQRRQLRTELKKARTKAGLTQLEVAARMDWSPSKLIRIEAGQVGVSTNDLRALLHEYGIVDQQRLDYFLELARASRKMPYREYRGLLPKPYMDLLSYEVAASIVRSFEPLVIPGLLQIEEYTRATSLAFAPHITGERMDRAVEARLQRQELLESEHRPEFFFIIDEAAIHRWTGGPGVMKSQLLHLKEMATRPGISIQIVPFSVGAHVGLQGSFVLLEFNGEMDDILYLEKTSGDSVFSDDTEATSRYLETFWALEAQAPREDLPRLIDRAIEGMNGVPEARPSVEVSVEA
ncbi:Helix-turn-helix [Streptomyces netropsis]|uniref:Transcriptional regulator with XRE-family HTH domain n=1 Tax=Streptomyces syringium TaxID=76729 RepID=A0ABS4Y2Z2_9ACTN|nr:helix-turn-helix transcriptional regulator [Streptomyces syringium]MBP2403150.1 transcriptional regulator with XRE-family HTH domain [Streptomyces syringium]SPE52787.1 Helix-turn-helix [Streptomyces netropsis]